MEYLSALHRLLGAGREKNEGQPKRGILAGRTPYMYKQGTEIPHAPPPGLRLYKCLCRGRAFQMITKEDDAKRDAVLLRMLRTPPKAHKDEKHPRQPKPKPRQAIRKKRGASVASTT